MKSINIVFSFNFASVKFHLENQTGLDDVSDVWEASPKVVLAERDDVKHQRRYHDVETDFDVVDAVVVVVGEDGFVGDVTKSHRPGDDGNGWFKLVGAMSQKPDNMGSNLVGAKWN